MTDFPYSVQSKIISNSEFIISGSQMEAFEKRKLKTLTVGQRLEVIDRYVSGVKIMDIAKQYNVPQSTVSTIIKQKDKWLKRMSATGNLES